MNPWVELLADGKLTQDSSKPIRIEDNVGESIHIHFRGSRLEMSIEDFYTFSKEVNNANKKLNYGDN